MPVYQTERDHIKPGEPLTLRWDLILENLENKSPILFNMGNATAEQMSK